MKAEALRDLSSSELRDRAQELREQLLKLRFQDSTGQIENPQMLRGVRKDIARAETLLRERELGIGPRDAGIEPTAGAGGEAKSAEE